jgi:hypothetical protein
MMYIPLILVMNLAVTLLVAYYYYRTQLKSLPYEDYDGDTRNTLLGMMVVCHHLPKSYWRHLVRQLHQYFTFYFCLCLIELVATVGFFLFSGRH